MGRLLGIARHGRPRGPMETLDHAEVSLEGGIQGDCRGILKPGGRNRRQVTVMALADWEAALAELGRTVPWAERRVNLLVDGLDLYGTTGRRLLFAGGVALDVTGECDPCHRMEAIAPGLEAALRPAWRGGITCRVASGGPLTIGDDVTFEDMRIEAP